MSEPKLPYNEDKEKQLQTDLMAILNAMQEQFGSLKDQMDKEFDRTGEGIFNA